MRVVIDSLRLPRVKSEGDNTPTPRRTLRDPMSPTFNDYHSLLCKDESRYVAGWTVDKAGIGLKLLVGSVAEVFGLLLDVV